MLRERLGAWLSVVGASAADIVAIESAVLEAVTNAVEHAYDGCAGRVQVEPRVTLGGPIDISTVGDLRRQLWSANRAVPCR